MLPMCARSYPLLVSDTASGKVTSLMFDGLVDIDPDCLMRSRT